MAGHGQQQRSSEGSTLLSPSAAAAAAAASAAAPAAAMGIGELRRSALVSRERPSSPSDIFHGTLKSTRTFKQRGTETLPQSPLGGSLPSKSILQSAHKTTRQHLELQNPAQPKSARYSDLPRAASPSSPYMPAGRPRSSSLLQGDRLGSALAPSPSPSQARISASIGSQMSSPFGARASDKHSPAARASLASNGLAVAVAKAVAEQSQGALACDMALLSSGQSLRPPPLRDNSFSCRDSGGIWSSDDDDGNDDSPELPALSSRARSVQADSPKLQALVADSRVRRSGSSSKAARVAAPGSGSLQPANPVSQQPPMRASSELSSADSSHADSNAPLPRWPALAPGTAEGLHAGSPNSAHLLQNKPCVLVASASPAAAAANAVGAAVAEHGASAVGAPVPAVQLLPPASMHQQQQQQQQPEPVELATEEELQDAASLLPRSSPRRIGGGMTGRTSLETAYLAKVAALQQLCTLDTGLLPGAGDDVDPSLRELLSEVQRFGLQQGVSRSSAVPEPVLRARYAAVSTKLDSLPSALCRTAASLMLVPLPGRHVRGYKVDRNGRVVRTAEVGGFLGMSPDPATVEHMQTELEASFQSDQLARRASRASAHSRSPAHSAYECATTGGLDSAASAPSTPMGGRGSAAVGLPRRPGGSPPWRPPWSQQVCVLAEAALPGAAKLGPSHNRFAIADADSNAWPHQQQRPQPAELHLVAEALGGERSPHRSKPAPGRRLAEAVEDVLSGGADDWEDECHGYPLFGSDSEDNGGSENSTDAHAAAATSAGTRGGLDARFVFLADDHLKRHAPRVPPKLHCAAAACSPGSGAGGGDGSDDDALLASKPAPMLGALMMAARPGAAAGNASNPSICTAESMAINGKSSSASRADLGAATSNASNGKDGKPREQTCGSGPVGGSDTSAAASDAGGGRALRSSALSKDDDAAAHTPPEDDFESAFQSLSTALEGARRAQRPSDVNDKLTFAGAARRVISALSVLGAIRQTQAEGDERAEAAVSALLESWAGDRPAQAEQCVMSLARLKEFLTPVAVRPMPQELKPFYPAGTADNALAAAADGARLASAGGRSGQGSLAVGQVSRRLQQCLQIGSDTLNLAMVPRLHHTDFGAVFQAFSTTPDAAAAVHRIVATDDLLSASGVDGLLELLKVVPGLTALDVQRSSAFGTDAATRLAALLQPGARLALSEVRLARCPIRDAGFRSLMAAAVFNKRLVSLDAGGCGLGNGALQGLEFFKENAFLEHLTLSENRFGQSGVAALVDDLSGNAALKELQLSRCGLDDRCASRLAELLATNGTLAALDVSHNAIGWEGARELAAGLLRAARTRAFGGGGNGKGAQGGAGRGGSGGRLAAIKLDGNPLCRFGVIELLKALQASDAMPHVSMVGCSLAPRAHHPPYYDPAYPNGTYVLDLAAPGERDTAARLVSDVWAPSGGASWAASHLNGQPFTLTPSMGWPGALPTIGVLRVDVVSARAVDPREVAPPGTATPDMPGGLRPHQQMSGHLLSCALSQLTSDAAGDEWRLGFVSLLTNVAHVTADQAAQLLGCFAYRKEKLDAARLLLSVTTDVHNLSSALQRPASATMRKPIMDADDWLDFVNLLGLGRLGPGGDSLPPGWQLACSGQYCLDLGQQVHRWFACLLTELAERQQLALEPLAEGMDMAAAVAAATLVANGGSAVNTPREPPGDADGGDPGDQQQRKEGASVVVPAGAVVRLGDNRSRLLGVAYNGVRLDSQAMYLASNMLPFTGQLLFSFFNPPMDRWRLARFKPARLAYISPALEILVGHETCVEDHLKVCSSNWAGLFLKLLRSLRHDEHHEALLMWSQASFSWKPQAMDEMLQQSHERVVARHSSYLSAAAPEDCSKAADTKHASSPNAADQATAKGKGKGKLGRGKLGGGKAAAKAAKAAGAAEAAKAASMDACVRIAAAAAREQLPVVFHHAVAHTVTCIQAQLMMRLLPDVGQRMDVLALLQPLLWDPSRVVDVILDLDHPVLVPLSKADYAKLHSPVASGANNAAVVQDGVLIAPPEPTPNPMDTTPCPPTNASTLRPPLGLQDAGSPDTPALLLQLAATRLGWCRLHLPWARPGSLDGIPIRLSLIQAEHLQCLMRLCRFADLVAPSIAAQPTAVHVPAASAALAVRKDLGNIQEAPKEATSGGGPAGSTRGHVLLSLRADGGPFELTLAAPPGRPAPQALQQVLRFCCLPAPSSGITGTVELQLSVTRDQQLLAAVTIVQAAWRGWRTRRQLYHTLRDSFGSNTWRAMWACYVFQRRITFMRRLATDLSMSNVLHKLQLNTGSAVAHFGAELDLDQPPQIMPPSNAKES